MAPACARSGRWTRCCSSRPRATLSPLPSSPPLVSSRAGHSDGRRAEGRWRLRPLQRRRLRERGARSFPASPPRSCTPSLPAALRLFSFPAGGVGTMSDSEEEESPDRQLKLVVLGDGTTGKVSAGPRRQRPAPLRRRGAPRPLPGLPPRRSPRPSR